MPMLFFSGRHMTAKPILFTVFLHSPTILLFYTIFQPEISIPIKKKFRVVIFVYSFLTIIYCLFRIFAVYLFINNIARKANAPDTRAGAVKFGGSFTRHG